MAITLKPINRQRVTFTIKGTAPLIQHKWSEKAKAQIRDKKLGDKAKKREKLDMDAEFKAATYLTDDDRYGIPILAFKASLIGAAHKDIGLEKTLVKKSFFVPCTDSNMIVPMECSDPIMREDYVRVGVSGTDLRYRPEFKDWSVEITAEIDADMLTIDNIAMLINRAGFGVGIGEWRPEKGGEFGRFKIDQTKPIDVEVLTDG